MASFVRRTPLVGAWTPSRPSLRSLLRASSFVHPFRSLEVSKCLTVLDSVVPSSDVSVRVDVALAFEASSTHLQVLWSGLRNSRFLGFVLPSDMSRSGGSSTEKVRSC